ncbi:MAG: repeat-containing protein [Cyanobacteria bacterium RYN_339]|nr:repeat-containing protein [Cyanobacteria bacterium RYN_339]
MSRLAPLLLAIATLSACTAVDTTSVNVSSTGIKAAADLSGVARVPAKLLSPNGGTIVSNNGGTIISDGGSTLVASNSSRYLLALGAEDPLPDALVYLTDPKDNFYRASGKMISTITGSLGEYRFNGGVPKKQPVIVNAILAGNRRLVGFTVPEDGTPQKVDLSVSSTYVTEFLRQQSAGDGRSMGSYDLKLLDDLSAKTKTLLVSDRLSVPDLAIGSIPDMDRGYALTVGQTQDLGDLWAKVLGRRVLALLTVAGTGNSGSSGDGSAATAAEFYRPRQAVSDAAGNIFVADEGNHKVRRIDAKTGKITTVAGNGKGSYGGDNGPGAQAALFNPRCVALDGAGNLYIGDQTNARIRRVDAKTQVITTVVGNPGPDGNGGFLFGYSGDGGPSQQAQIYQPRSITFDSAGNMFFADSEKDTNFHTVRRVDAVTGIITTVVGQAGLPGAFDGDGGQPARARLNYPNEICFDAQGRLLIADTGNSCIRRVDFKANTITTLAGVGGHDGEDPDGLQALKTRLSSPYGVAITADGRLYISERGTEKIVTVGSDGVVHTVAGGGTDVREGDARRTKLTQPHDLWVEPNGNVLIADTRGSRIRRLITRFGL